MIRQVRPVRGEPAPSPSIKRAALVIIAFTFSHTRRYLVIYLLGENVSFVQPRQTIYHFAADGREYVELQQAIEQADLSYSVLQLSDKGQVFPDWQPKPDSLFLLTLTSYESGWLRLIEQVRSRFPILPIWIIQPGITSDETESYCQAGGTRSFTSIENLMACGFSKIEKDTGKLRLNLVNAELSGVQRGFYQGAARLLHDMNSPLTALQNSYDLLMRQLKKQQIETDSNTVQLFESSLSSLRSTANKWQEVLFRSSDAAESVDLYAILMNSIQRVHQRNPEIRITTSPDFLSGEESCNEPTRSSIEIEPFALDQILHQLLTNAVEALHGIPSPHIQLTVTEEEHQITILLDNNGATIPEELRTTLWKDFVSDKGGHFGLGLGVVRYLLMKHGGSIRHADSKLGGAAFQFSFRKRSGMLNF